MCYIEEHLTLQSYSDGKIYDLVMSDEFNRDGRSFKDGDDPMWTAIDKSDDDLASNGRSLEYYNSSMAYTKGGNLVIETNADDTVWTGFNPFTKKDEVMTRNFKSAMVQGWNKFCYTGGILGTYTFTLLAILLFFFLFISTVSDAFHAFFSLSIAI